RIFVGYDENEDRILVDLSNAESRCRLWLTRRITRRLWSAIIEIVERSSPTVLKTPADMRKDVIAFEHLSAISRPEPAEGGAPPAPVADRGTALLRQVDINFTQEAFRLIFHSATGAMAGLTVGRTELHKVLSLIDQCAKAADWELGVTADWLQAPTAPVGPEKLAS